MFRLVEPAYRRTRAYLSEGPSLAPRWIALIAIASTAAFLLLMNVELSIYDESLVMQGAVEVGLGYVPHRDFFWTYGPMQLWIVSALFSAFGRTMIVARLYDVAVRGGIVLLCGWTARRLGLRASFAAGMMLVEAALMYEAGFYMYPVFPSMLCALAGTLFLVDHRPGAEVRTGRLIAAGSLTGLTALIRYDIGFFLLSAHLLSLVLFWVHARRSVGLVIRQVVTYGAGVSIVFLPAALGGWIIGAGPGFIHDIIRFPPANYARMRGLPWPVPGLSVPALISLINYVSFLALVPGVTWVALAGLRSDDRTGLGAEKKLGMALLLLVALFALKGVVRVSLIHSLLAVVPAILFLAFLVGRREAKAVWWPALAVLVLAMFTVSLDALGMLRAEEKQGFHRLFIARIAGDTPPTMRGARCATLPTLGVDTIDGDTYRAACYIAVHTGPRDLIYVGAGRHDKVFENNVALYFLSNRQPATHWYHIEPGLQTQSAIQQRIINDLNRNDVKLVATDRRFDDVSEPNGSAISSGVRDLDRFIAKRYMRVAQFGSISILRRRSNPDIGTVS